jgi:molecular chaperone IbpA
MRYDLAPLYRATVGFDRLANLLDSVSRGDEQVSYPPYNIEKLGEDNYRISMAVAGFGESELEITVKESSLVVAGKKSKTEENGNGHANGHGEGNFLYRGIAQRAFERRFDLADHIKVTGAKLENGLLHIDLVREIPEAKKPRTVRIESGVKSQPKVIDQAAA